MKRTFSLILLILFSIPCLAAITLKNSGFNDENNGYPVGWNLSTTQGISVQNQAQGRVLYMKNSSFEYKQAWQDIDIEPASIPCITVKAKVRVSNIVKGREDWEMARVMVLFFNSKGGQTGGWPELGRWKGTADWGDKINVINVPADAVKIRVQPELSNCTGEMWVDAIEVSSSCNIDIPRDKDDFLMNGDMEFGSSKPLFWGGWIANEGNMHSPGYKSATCYKITNTSPSYSMLTQEIPLDTEKIGSINISGWYKTENVEPGQNQWEKARISVEFQDDKERVGSWPPVVCEAIGTIGDWTYCERDYLIPADAKKAIISAGLLNCTGTMYVDKIKVTARTTSGEPYLPPVIKQEDRSSWVKFRPQDDPYSGDAVIDLSYTLDAPAGKHGAITVSAKDGSLVFEDGTKARFWGTNLVAGDVFRTKEEIDLTVKRLAKLGCNLVRLHHMDAFWAEPGIFEKNSDNTRDFSAESLDRLDYLVYRLKEAGIYVFMDTLVHRRLKKGDGVDGWEKVPAGFKEVIYIDEKLQELTMQYMKNLFSHVNAYTKTSYKDEPAVILTEIINESSLFYWDRNRDIPEAYTARLDTLFNGYLKKKYGSMENLKKAWAEAGGEFPAADEDFNRNSVRRENFTLNWEDWQGFATATNNGRAMDTKMFYYDTQNAFYDKMYYFLKGLGVKCLIAGSNHWEKWDADLASNARYDFIDRHSYWDHPSGGWTMQENISFKNTPMLKSSQNCVAELAHARVFGKPFTVSEWNALLPNEYRAGAPVIMAAYARLQDWDAMMQFNFGSYAWKPSFEHFADFSRDPAALSMWLPAVMIFRQDYLKTGPERLVEYISEDLLFSSKETSFKLVNSDYSSPLMIKVAKTFSKTSESRLFNPVMKAGAALSLTQELYWNIKKGLFQVTADRIQGAAGFLKGEQLKFKNLRISCSTPYAAAFLLSIDGKPISSSNKLALCTAARTDNTGSQYGPSRTSVIFGGSAPIIQEPVTATFTITLSKALKLKVFTLDANGYKSGEYGDYTNTGNQLIIRTGPNSGAFTYLIEKQ